MKSHIASLSLICLLCLSVTGTLLAQGVIYDNGPVNGTVDAWTINFGYVVSDTFAINGFYAIVTGFDFWVWELPGDKALTVDWSLTRRRMGGIFSGVGRPASWIRLFLSTNMGMTSTNLTSAA